MFRGSSNAHPAEIRRSVKMCIKSLQCRQGRAKNAKGTVAIRISLQHASIRTRQVFGLHYILKHVSTGTIGEHEYKSFKGTLWVHGQQWLAEPHRIRSEEYGKPFEDVKQCSVPKGRQMVGWETVGCGGCQTFWA